MQTCTCCFGMVIVTSCGLFTERSMDKVDYEVLCYNRYIHYSSKRQLQQWIQC